MSLFRRRRETLNEQLMREARLAPAQASSVAPEPAAERFVSESPRMAGNRAVFQVGQEMREFDAVVSVHAPDLRGDEVEFVALSDGSLLVEEEEGDADLAPLADAVEAELPAPYRAHGVRRSQDVWAVAANPIQVAELQLDGDIVDLSVVDGVSTLTVDGEQTSGGAADLEQLAPPEGGDYAIHAERLERGLWEVRVSAL
jgi:hypothetical protein